MASKASPWPCTAVYEEREIMTKLVLDDIGSTLTNTAATTLNNNNAKIEQALENTLSRDGSTPNNMQADLDMDSNDLLNVDNLHANTIVLDGTVIQIGNVTNALLISNALSELAPVGLADDARNNLGLGTAATQPIDAFATAHQGDLAEFAALTFSSRAALVATITLIVPDAGLKVSDGVVEYVYDGVTTAISDLIGWRPFGDVYADHFAQNVTPGTTDMKAAINAAIAYTDEVFLLGNEYLVSGSILMTERNKSLIGQGWLNTTITCNVDTTDIIVQSSSESTVFGQSITNLIVRYANGTKTAGAHIRTMKPAINCNYEGLILRNIFDGFRFAGAQLCWLTRIRMEQTGIGLADKGRYGINFDAQATGSFDYATDVHIDDIDIAGFKSNDTSGLVAGIRINRADGVYISNSHFGWADYGLLINPDGGLIENRVTTVKFTNCYFDTAYISNVLLTGSATSIYRQFDFADCMFRDARGSIAGVDIAGSVSNVSFSGSCKFWEQQLTGLRVTSSAANISINGAEFFNNNLANNASHADIIFNGDGLSYSGVSHILGGAAGKIIDVQSAATNWRIDGASITKSTAAGGIAIHATAAPNGFLEGAQRGSNANGSWVKRVDGSLEVFHRLVTSNSAAVTWTFPLAFLTATIPTVTRTAENAAPRIVTGDVPSTTQMQNINSYDLTTTRQVDAVEMRATGVWK